MKANVFLQAIREAPDDDTPRLVYADWLDDQGDADGAARAELIRLQCRLAGLSADDPARAALAAREKEVLDTHGPEWTDLAFARWLGHREKKCRNPEGHEFCKHVARGVRTRCALERLAKDDPRRAALEKKAKTLERRFENVFYRYTSATVSTPLFEKYAFCRGFLENATIENWLFVLCPGAVRDVGLVRRLEISDDALVDRGDQAVRRLVETFTEPWLIEFDMGAPIHSRERLHQLAEAPAVGKLERLAIWVEEVPGDEVAGILAASPRLANLRKLMLEVEGFTDAAVEALAGSPHLGQLTTLDLRDPEGGVLPLSAAGRRLYARYRSQFENPRDRG
jgi:uncharacterized protein (TIGR02996 family)